jgi:hypothetical protein
VRMPPLSLNFQGTVFLPAGHLGVANQVL